MQEQHERGRKSPTGPSPRSSTAQAPSGFDLEHRERSGCPGRLKSSLLDTHRVPLDVGELLRFEGAFVHAEDQGGRRRAICSFTYSKKWRIRAKSLLIMRYSIPSSRMTARGASFRKLPIRLLRLFKLCGSM